MKTAILFDLDGTLLDTLDDLTDAVNFTLRHYGCPQRTKMQVRSYLGSGARELIRLSLPGLPTDPDVDEALSFYKVYYNAHSQIKTAPYPGIVEALGKISTEFPVAVVTNKPHPAAEPLIRTHFGPDIYALGESPDCPRKPAPDMLYKAMAAIGAEKCIYVGDSEVDFQTAQNAGAPCLSVLWGFRDRDFLEEAGAQHFCDDPAKLLDALKELI